MMPEERRESHSMRKAKKILNIRTFSPDAEV
jgi:hypothetical protein